MVQKSTLQPANNNDLRGTMVVEVRLKVAEALSVGVIDSEVAEAAYADTIDASYTELRFIFERLESLVAAHLLAPAGSHGVAKNVCVEWRLPVADS